MMRRLLFLFLLFFGACESRAVGLIEPPQVSTAADGATVLRWKLDSPAGGRLRYGLAPNKLDQSASDEVGTDHTLTLRGLQLGTQYFYSIGTAKYPLTTGLFVAGKPGAVPEAKPTMLQKLARLVTKPTKATPISARITPAAPVSPKAVMPDAPATRLTWGHLPSLPDHFARHGRDFAATSQDDYAVQAWRFRERAVAERLPMKFDSDGTVRVFDPKTRAFAAFNHDGTTKTYFRPDSASYWQRQPGRAIQTPPWVSQ